MSACTYRMDKRQIVNYTLDEQWTFNTLSTIVKLELALMERDATLYHEERLLSAHQIITNFQNLQVVIQMVLGNTQSVKTGLMLATIKLYIHKNLIPIENIVSLLAYHRSNGRSKPNAEFRIIYSSAFIIGMI